VWHGKHWPARDARRSAHRDPDLRAGRLPEIGRGIGKGIRNFKDAVREGKDDQH